jgi:hypothetical protein
VARAARYSDGGGTVSYGALAAKIGRSAAVCAVGHPADWRFSLARAGVYKAWLSDSQASPLTRFTHSTLPYIRVDGTQIAADWAGLIRQPAHRGYLCGRVRQLPAHGIHLGRYQRRRQRREHLQ